MIPSLVNFTINSLRKACLMPLPQAASRIMHSEPTRNFATATFTFPDFESATILANCSSPHSTHLYSLHCLMQHRHCCSDSQPNILAYFNYRKNDSESNDQLRPQHHPHHHEPHDPSSSTKRAAGTSPRFQHLLRCQEKFASFRCSSKLDANSFQSLML